MLQRTRGRKKKHRREGGEDDSTCMQATASKEVTAILVLRGSGIFREKRYSAVTAVTEAIPYRRDEKQAPFKKSSEETGRAAFGWAFHAVKEIS